MALKQKIEKEAFEALSEAIQAEYKLVGEDYVLDVDGLEDTGPLKRAKDREAQKRKDAEKELKELKAKFEEIEGDDARKKGDIETLEKSWKTKLEKIEAEKAEAIAKKDAFIKKSLVDAKAMEIASKISNSPNVILPHIKARLTADLDNETGPQTKVLDAEGNLSAMSLEDLSTEFVENKDFSTIIIGSKASGGGTADKNKSGNGGASAGSKTDWSKADPNALKEHLAQKIESQEN